jgi:mRNA interferase MazF
MKRGEVWLVNLDPIIGREQAGTRPAVIVSAESFNDSGLELVIVCPITSKAKGFPTHVAVQPGTSGLHHESYIKTEDIRSIAIQRLEKKLGSVDEATLRHVARILQLLLQMGG